MIDLHDEIVLATPVEVMKDVWVGTQAAFENGATGWIFEPTEENPDRFAEHEWQVLHAAKEPYHRQFVGYTGRGAPKDSDEYLVAVRGNRMALNLIDVPNPRYIPIIPIHEGVQWVIRGLDMGRKVYVHCNMGVSRSPSIAMIVMARLGELSTDLEDARREFVGIYDRYMPGEGITGFLDLHWDKLVDTLY